MAAFGPGDGCDEGVWIQRFQSKYHIPERIVRLGEDCHQTHKKEAARILLYKARLSKATERSDACNAIQREAERFNALNASLKLANIATERRGSKLWRKDGKER